MQNADWEFFLLGRIVVKISKKKGESGGAWMIMRRRISMVPYHKTNAQFSLLIIRRLGQKYRARASIFVSKWNNTWGNVKSG